jgi:hypothetical protein
MNPMCFASVISYMFIQAQHRKDWKEEQWMAEENWRNYRKDWKKDDK